MEKPKPEPPQLLVTPFDEYRMAMEARGMHHNTLRSMGTVRNILAELALKTPRALTLVSYNRGMHDQAGGGADYHGVLPQSRAAE
ncbi:MAG TPA: hypothetical protein VF598_13245 [Hymenobacter sp.]